MTNRDMFIDLVDELDVKYIDSHIKRVAETKKQRIARYAAAGAVYAAACLVLVLAIPLIIGGGDDVPVVPGTDPVVVETVQTGTESETVTETEAFTETETATVETTTEETTVEETTTEETTEETTAETTTTVTTAAPVMPPEPVTYPEPYISNQTETSITKVFYGCEYTVTLDKAMYKAGDVVNVTVTLENKGSETLQFFDDVQYDFLSLMHFYVGRASVYDTFVERSIYNIDPNIAILNPGGKWTCTTKIDTTGFNDNLNWSVKTTLNFVIDEKIHESIDIKVPHE